LKQHNTTHMCLLSSNWGRLLALGVAEYDLMKSTQE